MFTALCPRTEVNYSLKLEKMLVAKQPNLLPKTENNLLNKDDEEDFIPSIIHKWWASSPWKSGSLEITGKGEGDSSDIVLKELAVVQ